MEKGKTIDDLIATAAGISNSLLGLEDNLAFCFSGGKATPKEVDKLNGLLTAVCCLAQQHENNLLEFEKECMKARE